MKVLDNNCIKLLGNNEEKLQNIINTHIIFFKIEFSLYKHYELSYFSYNEYKNYYKNHLPHFPSDQLVSVIYGFIDISCVYDNK